MRDKLIELLVKSRLVDEPEDLADYLIAHGVTVQADVPDNNVGNKLKITGCRVLTAGSSRRGETMDEHSL